MLESLHYRRTLVWNQEPGPDKILTIQGVDPLPERLVAFSEDGTVRPSPHQNWKLDNYPNFPEFGIGPIKTDCAPVSVYFTDCAVGEHGGVAFDVDMSPVSFGEQPIEFCMYYGAGTSEEDAMETIDLLSVEFYSLVKSTPDGTPVTFFMAVGCLEPPVAQFEILPGAVCASGSYSPGSAAWFRDLSHVVDISYSDPVQSWWDFGDGNTTTTAWNRSLQHTYERPGDYEVTLRVMDKHDMVGTTSTTITVLDCSPPNEAPWIDAMPCIEVRVGQHIRFPVRATDPDAVPKHEDYYALRLTAPSLPDGASFSPVEDVGTVRQHFVWRPDALGEFTASFHVEDRHAYDRKSAEAELCIRVLPDKPAPQRGDDSGDGVQNWHDACPHAKNPDQGDAAGGGLDDPCDPAAPPEPEETQEEEGPPPGGCPSQPAGPREVTARWSDGAVQVSWQSDSWCPPDHFLVWNGTGHHLVDFVPAAGEIQFVVFNVDPWPEPHQYYVQAMGAEEGLFFDPTRAVASNLIDPGGCVFEGARSEACLPPGLNEEPPAAVEPAVPEAAAPADGAPVGLIAAAAALVVGGLMALLWRLRHAPWVVHLFTRLGHDDALKHPLRKEISGLVGRQPGIHYRELLRRTGMSNGALRHHLDAMVAAGKVAEHQTGRYACYYPPDDKTRRAVREARHLLHGDAARQLLRLVLDEPGLSAAECARRLGVDPTTVRYHLERFERGGLARLERKPRLTQAYPGRLSKEAMDALDRVEA